MHVFENFSCMFEITTLDLVENIENTLYVVGQPRDVVRWLLGFL